MKLNVNKLVGNGVIFRIILISLVVWISTAGPNTSVREKDFSDYTFQIPGTDESIEMISVPGGTFLMGSPEDEHGREDHEGPQRSVYVDSFWMTKYPITWDQYDLFVEEEVQELRRELSERIQELGISSDAISTPTPPYMDMSFGMGREGYPAINMTQYAASMFAKWLSAKTGEFYRLPTEAEWEYACKAGSADPYSIIGNDSSKLDKYAWYEANSNKYQQVGTKKPNAFGLHDMLGNVAEWTLDQFHEDYFERLEGDTSINPWFRPTQLYPRSVRGGSWQDSAEDQRCAKRRGSVMQWKRLDPQLPKSRWWHTSAPFLGFRIVRPKKAPPKDGIEEYWIKVVDDFY